MVKYPWHMLFMCLLALSFLAQVDHYMTLQHKPQNLRTIYRHANIINKRLLTH